MQVLLTMLSVNAYDDILFFFSKPITYAGESVIREDRNGTA